MPFRQSRPFDFLIVVVVCINNCTGLAHTIVSDLPVIPLGFDIVYITDDEKEEKKQQV
jgi:hypothetical protein